MSQQVSDSTTESVMTDSFAEDVTGDVDTA
jgi:hypothetical protein